jgi:putative membrane protein
VNNLLPAAPVSGELVRTRLAMFSGMSGPAAGASVTADLTFGALSQVVFSLLGVGALLYLGASFGNAMVAAISIGLVIIGALLGVFLVLQNFGLFRFLADRLVGVARGRAWLDLVGGAERMDAELTALYRRRASVSWSLFWRLAAWLAGTGEIWLGMYFLGHPIGLIEAIMVESVIQAIRAAAFAIPGGLGVQEAGFVLLGSFIGLGPEISLALALLRRARELLFGVPGLIAWQIQEGHRVLRRGRG